MRQATQAIHAAAPERRPGEPLTPSLVAATSFHTNPDAVGFSAADLGAEAPLFYTRWGNPTVALLEQRLAALEGGEAGLAFASGMAAASGLMLHRLGAGGHLVISDVCYAGVAEFARETLCRFGVLVTAVDMSDLGAVAAAMRPETRLVHAETPANPILRLADIAALAEIAHRGGAELSVDSTMATPVATRPLELGADWVAHSLTKYACGHGDALGGAVIGRADAVAALRREALIHVGGAISPFAAWLILRGLETLPARMALHQHNAGEVARYLQAHPRLRRVYWPGLPSHPQHELARRQMRNFSGMVCFAADDDKALARQLAARLRVVTYAVSLGKTQSLLFHIPTDDILRSSFGLEGAQAAAYRAWTGEGTFRLSVGLEDPADILADLEQALR
ncbi:trans-sulfuration enzyme family protein [Teichococcus vastitatis]|uniref:Aminotransferase class I/II-fold pyridoxal phosphate-dependent enzyme n=1 Tax=Teichococcus vastitatis TaxID=2307076 RepID=A0ABS9W9J7_9PROT|nr:aminotransferase class I/II-fold pyridoxal phosphate-dependent enzyme [Pseudoroseomonas vastitatis]MCI0755975.1 aminotransferase class I/II-fold pyridoxal phosphate-dependent enzyme [Pseudoroseomonas vastitatis]